MKNGKTCFGVIIGTRAYFNSELAKDVRKQLLKTLDEGGYEYIILPEDATPTGSSSIETREDGLKVSKQFRAHRDEIDGIIVSLPNFGFEIGIINAISDAELNVPVLVQACDDENDKVDLDSRRDAFCGKISVCNNLYQYGIPFIFSTGLSQWIGESLTSALGGQPSEYLFLTVFAVTALLLSELTSNTAVANLMGPIAIATAASLGFSPVPVCVVMALCTSLAFMLPVSTPPNAIVYASGYVPITKMIKAGVILDIIGVFAITIPLVYFVVKAIMGV